MNFKELGQALNDMYGPEFIAHPLECENGEVWNWYEITNMDKLNLAQIKTLLNLAGAEVVEIIDTAPLAESVIDDLDKLFGADVIGVYPTTCEHVERDKEWAVTVTTWTTYKVKAKTEQDAKDLLDEEKPHDTISSEVNAELYEG